MYIEAITSILLEKTLRNK